ncbi:unnamed protein product [Caenorhabditis angaria]|uniref:Uncharacterized protein n=1 Tax=Caenorhabditis angaria TaxID=860376 RepID=A0A9P1I6A0_9PELO|nr:unnamed protein product [Caenorhabditis angaria]
MAAKIFGAVSKKLERRQSTSSSDDSIESGNVTPRVVNMPAYNQSSTRKLAFGTSETEEHKPLDDFYNNSTLTNFTKLFCAIVLLCAFLLVMSRSLQLAYDFDNTAPSSQIDSATKQLELEFERRFIELQLNYTTYS